VKTWSFRKAGARWREAGLKDFSAEKYFWRNFYNPRLPRFLA
jgi:hypothetical protein